MVDIEDIKEVPASKFQTPAILVNHVQILRMEETLFLEFRLILPDIDSSTQAGLTKYAINPDIKEIPPQVRLVLNMDITQALIKALQNNISTTQ